MVHSPSLMLAIRHKRVLLLQGPMGPFFRRLADDLTHQGCIVEKVNFNGGDSFFYPSGARAFRGPMSAWPEYLHQILSEKPFDLVLLFGDCRPLHHAAKDVAKRHGVTVGVFEEGYVRPNFITLERGGVNANSSMPREPAFFRSTPPGASRAVAPAPQVANAFWFMALWAVLYYVASAILRPWFSSYQHHRRLSIGEAIPWLRAVLRKRRYARQEAGLEALLTGPKSKEFYLVPLQVHNDSQVSVHSTFASVSAFIEEVIASFAHHAPPSTLLAIKHHPLDRAYTDYTGMIAAATERLQLQGRVLYLHDQHLPSLLEHARGSVVINSTVGLQALDHGTPLKVCGRSIYDMEGLTFQGSLNSFWKAASGFQLDSELFAAFKAVLMSRTQIGGSFYRALDTGATLHVHTFKEPSKAYDLDLSPLSGSSE